MQIIFKTNIDAYNSNDFCLFSDQNSRIPIIGEKINVMSPDRFKAKKLPTRLEVKDVNWYSDKVEIELHYNETDLKLCSAAGGKPYG